LADRLLLIVFVLLRSATCVLFADEVQLDFFESRIRPVLVQHCYECHSVAAGKSSGGLLLDSRSGWMTGGDSGPAIVPGRPEASHVWQAISSSGEVSEMPPKSRLAAEIVENFRLWILNGAIDPREAPQPLARGRVIDLAREREFWAYQPRRVFNAGHSIDGFVQPSADPATADRLLRRLSLDLTGLPPTLQERTAFLDAVRQQSVDKATEALVDELLERNQFGEKWARHWLDVVRYADSNGGDFNLTFEEAWRYRNYVIDAFNDDVPYDRFLQEQIAGDLLPWKDEEQRNRQLIATGFLMVGAKMLTERDKVKMHLDIADEQLDTIGRAVMGLTLGCARCHDHKFDPIPATDYYALAGILHSTRTADRVLMGNVNVTGWTNTDLLLDEQGRVELAAYESRVRFLKEALTSKERAAELAERSAGIVVDDMQAELSGPWRKSTLRKNRIGPHYLASDPGQDSCRIVWKAALPSAGRYQLRVTFGGGDGLAKTAEYVVRHSDGETKVIVDQTRKPVIRGLWQLLGEFDFVDSAEVSLSDRNAGGHVIADAIQLIPVGVAETADAPAELALLAEIAALRKELDGLEKDGPGTRQAMAAMDNQNERMGDLHLRIRGEADNLGPRVPRGFLKVAEYDGQKAATFTAEESGRRQLAEWITHPNHPLTAAGDGESDLAAIVWSGDCGNE
jgi:cytochrome c553